MPDPDEKDPKGSIASFAVGFAQAGEAAGKPPEAELERGEFVVLVVAELSGRAEYSTRATRSPRLVPVDRSSFDGVMAELAPSIAVEVPEPWSGKQQRIDLRFASLKDFRPAELAEKIAPLRTCLEAHRVLARVGRRELDAQAARAELGRLLPESNRRDALLRGLATPAEAAKDTTKDTGSALDRLLAQVDLTPAAQAGAAPAGAGFEAALSDVRAALAELLTAVVEHPEVKRLEERWRGLSAFVKDAAASGVGLQLFDGADPEQAIFALKTLVGRRTGVVPDLIVVDQQFSSSARDVDLLERWAALGEELLAPVIAGADPSLLGAGDL
jgi:type VI secretion system protein ImpC